MDMPGSQNGEAPRHPHAAEVKEHLRAARKAATEAVKGRTERAQGWARSQLGSLQGRVESDPYRASAWALGIGFVAGILLTSLLRSGRS
ncbi:MAG TPA: hypothetical protein VIL32_18185 [Steroidobacteraceae bacterium]